jgi:hypothetical protein
MNIALALAPLLAPVPQHELPDPSRALAYDYVEAVWIRSDVDGIADEFEGFGLGGSVALTDDFYLRAAASRLDVDVGGFDADTLDLSALLGFRYGLDDGFDAIVEAGAGRTEIDVSGVPGSPDAETGFLASSGLRYRANYTWEFEGTLDFAQFNGDGEFGGSVAVRAHISNNASIVASWGTIDDADTLALGVRWQW